MASNDSQHVWDLMITAFGMSNNTYVGVPPLRRPVGGNALAIWNHIVQQFGHGRFAAMIAHAPPFGAATTQPPAVPHPPAVQPHRRRTLKPSHAVQRQRRRAQKQVPAPPPLATRQLYGYHAPLFPPQQPATHPPHLVGATFHQPLHLSRTKQAHRKFVPSSQNQATLHLSRRQQRSVQKGFTRPPPHSPRYRRYGTLAMAYGERPRVVPGFNDLGGGGGEKGGEEEESESTSRVTSAMSSSGSG